MHRRTMLKRTGAAMTALVLAGCAGPGGEGEDNETDGAVGEENDTGGVAGEENDSGI